MNVIMTIVSALTFAFYGILCLTTSHMKKEFIRWGVGQFRPLTGALELLGGLGLIVGLWYPSILIISSGGLATLMLLATIVRLKTKDSLKDISPAFSLLLINGYLLFQAIF